jgi:two-component system response regulator FixJ
MDADTVVHVIDDDKSARESLTFLLQAAGLTVETYESATVFLVSIATAKPGCVVTDVRMPGLSGLELLHELKRRQIGLPVIVITGHGDVPLAVEAMKSGALDFLEKPFDDEALIDAVNVALRHHGADAKREADRDEVVERLATLSNRERQVLEGLVAGHANKTIAYDRGISPRTVEIYRANVMAKMHASSLSDLVRMALIGGVIVGAPAAGRGKSPK